jgi:hypothetical protein
MPDDTARPWHRLFGITLTDLFAGTPWRVELAQELALRSQLLDVVSIEHGVGDARAAAAPAWTGSLRRRRTPHAGDRCRQGRLLPAWPSGDPGRSARSERKRSTGPLDDNRFAPQGRLRLTAAGAAVTG